MRKKLIFDGQEVRFLREMVRRKVDFMIVGLSAAALQGAPVVTQDVDLWFRDLGDPGLRRALAAVKASYVPPMGDNPPVLAGEAVKLFDIVTHMHGLDSYEREKKTALKISLGEFKVAVLSLERIIRSKRAAGRQKDKLVLAVLTDVLKTIKRRRSGR